MEHVRCVHFECDYRHNEDNSTECAKCDKTFANVTNLNLHIKTVHQKLANSFKCEKCEKTFCEKRILDKHKSNVHKVESEYFFCNVTGCSARCKDEKGLKLHMKKYHEKINHHKSTNSSYCEKCEKTFSTKSDLKKHKSRVHREEYEYLVCKVSRCMAKCKNEEGLKLHMKNFHERNRSTTCDQCGKEFENFKLLMNHEKKVHFSENGGKYLMCKVSRCSAKFEDEVTRKLHVKNYHERNRSTICDQCGKSYINTSALCKHEKVVHLKMNEEAECDICGKIVAHKKSLISHKLTVHKIQRSSSRKMSDHRKFKCKLCKQKFTEKLDLYKHMSENHQGTNKFKCTQCPRSFSSFERLKNHESIAHENENMYHCSMCTKVFEDFESLEIHQNDKHEMTKENFCGFCNHTFTLKRLFKKHLEKCSKKNSRKNHTKN